MRSLVKALSLTALIATQGCSALEFLGGRCTQEQIVVTWPVAITRGSMTSNVLLTNTITPENIDPSQFDLLRRALVNGDAAAAATVVWTVSAFEVNGGYIALSHAAPLSSGDTQQITGAFDGGGWGATPASRPTLPVIAVRADNFVATDAAGSMTILDNKPLRLRIDVTVRNAAGETMQISGDAGFAYQKVTKTCT